MKRKAILPILILAMLVLFPSVVIAVETELSADLSTAEVDNSDDWDESLDDDFEDDIGFDDAAIPDPLEPFNRAMFVFNDKLYFYFLKPVARGYRVVPLPVRLSVGKFFSNVETPIRLVNNALQLKLENAGTELMRFVINTTVGVLGLFDPARKYWGLRRKVEDFGQTMGHYGVGPGFYLVLPFYGPYTLRDSTGLLLDTLYLDPIYRYVDGFWVRVSIRGFNMVNTLSLDKDTYEALKRDALDPYTFVKHAYAQHRAGQIRE